MGGMCIVVRFGVNGGCNFVYPVVEDKVLSVGRALKLRKKGCGGSWRGRGTGGLVIRRREIRCFVRNVLELKYRVWSCEGIECGRGLGMKEKKIWCKRAMTVSDEAVEIGYRGGCDGV